MANLRNTKKPIFSITTNYHKISAIFECADFTRRGKHVYKINDEYYISLVNNAQFNILFKDDSGVSCFYFGNYTINDNGHYVIDISDYSGIHRDELHNALI